MITTTYNYSSGTGFVYDSAKIGFSGSMAKLIAMPNPGVFTQDFASSAGFTYNSANTEFVGGAMRQIDQRPANATYYASFASALAANWGDGSLVVSGFNGAAVSAGALDLKGSTNKYVSFDATANMASLQVGTVEIQVTPNYSGNPVEGQVFFNVSRAAGSPINLIDIEHVSSGQLFLQIWNAAGVQTAVAHALWVPVAGQTYTLLAQFNGNTGLVELYVDGTLFASVNQVFTRSGAVAYGTSGKYFDSTIAGVNANFSIKNVAYYSVVTTPSSPVLPPTLFLADTITLPTFSYTGLLNILAWTSLVITDANTPHYTFNGLYWNGSAWVATSNTYGTANDATTAADNIAALPPANTVVVKVYWQSSNTAQMSVDLLTLNYTGQIYSTSNPTIAPNTPLTLDELDDFTSVFSASGSDGVQFYLAINSTNYWWNGSVWATSNGTYAQSNTAADILANSGTLPVTLGVFFTPYAILHSASGLTTPTLTSLTIVYDFFGEEPAGPNVCTVFGYLLDENKNPIAGATVTATNPATFFNQGIVQAQGSLSSVTDAEGYFHFSLMETATAAKQLTFTVRYPANPPRPPGSPGAASFGRAAVPNLPSVNFVDMVFS